MKSTLDKSSTYLDDNIHQYILDNSLRESDVLTRLRLETAKDPAAIMQIPPEQGQLMSLLVQLISAKRSIEIGVFTGYSALCVAQAMPSDSYTVACDINEDWTKTAERYWEEAGIRSKIDLRIAPASETLEQLLSEGQGGTFDFIFIDADKENYDVYYELSLQLLRKGGVIAIDNVLLFGSVVDSNIVDEPLRNIFSESSIKAIRELNIKIKNDDRVDISMLPVADGLTLVRKQ
ncbi:MAG: SAM-dependent methyltransferase [Moraxellaceae bacterium]|nr:MAG: SAM-dependent methyltransferase [Moraxellaceae bacterium]